MYLEAAKHSVEPALTVTEQDTYLYQSGWYRRVIGPFFGSDDPAFFVSVDRISSLFSEKEKERKKMIVCLRVDERLIHGQVAMTWTKELKLNGLVVASDEAASNEIQKMTLKMAVPEGIKCIIKSVEDVTTILDDPRSESMRLMVLVPTVKDAVTLCKRYKNIEMVNIGNAGKMTSGEKKILSKEVMLTADELEALKELTELYPDTFFQGTPAMEKKMASAILKGC